MNRLLLYLGSFLLFFLVSCQEEEPVDVAFHLKLVGFEMEQAEEGDWPPISHELAGGVVYLISDEKYMEFDAREDIQDYEFNVPEGQYGIVIKVKEASLYGQELATFNLLTHFIDVSAGTDTIVLDTEPACAMVRVSDPGNKLKEGPYMIERHSYADGYFIPFPMIPDSASGDYYVYFSPDPKLDNPSAFLWFYAGIPGPETGGLATTGMEVGKQYRIRIVE